MQQQQQQGGRAPPPQQQQQQQNQQDYDDLNDDMGPEITLRDLLVYSLRNYVFSLVGDMASKLFVAPVERLNVLYQTDREIADIGIDRNLGGVPPSRRRWWTPIVTAPKTIINVGLGDTISSALVMQFWRTTLRSFTSSAFYIVEPMAGPVIASPTYFFYVRPIFIDLLNLLCVYPIDTAATIAMADNSDIRHDRGSSTQLIQRVLLNPKESLRGFTVTALGMVVYRTALSTVTSVLANNDLIPHGVGKRFLLQNAVLFGCTALVYPFDTIRRRLIVRNAFKNSLTSRSTASPNTRATTTSSGGGSSSSTNLDEGYAGTRDAIKKIYEQEGIAGFFAGIEMRMLRMCGGAFFYGMVQLVEMWAAGANIE